MNCRYLDSSSSRCGTRNRAVGGSRVPAVRANLTFYSDVLNDLSIAIPELAPFEIGKPILLTADARSGELPLIDASATVVAFRHRPRRRKVDVRIERPGRGWRCLF